MKARVDAKALAKAAATVAPFVGRWGSIPALGAIRIEATGDRLTLTASDIEHTCTTTVAAEVEGEGVICAPVAGFTGLSAQLEGTATVAVDGGDLILVGDGREASLRAISADEWPRLAHPVADVALGDAWRAMGSVLHAASLDNNRPILCCLRVAEGAAVATDSFRLAWATAPDGLDFMVPSVGIRRAAKLLDGDVSIGADRNGVSFSDGTTTITSRQAEGEFPNWRGLVPKSHAWSATIATWPLLDAIAFAAALPHDRKTAVPVRFSATDSGLRVRLTETDVGDAAATLAADVDGTWPESIGFDPAFLAEAIRATGADEVELQGIDANKPVRILGGGLDQILMPVRG